MARASARSPKSYSGFVPYAAIGVGAGVGGWIASFIAMPEWTLAVPGMVLGYFLSGKILERVYAGDDD